MVVRLGQMLVESGVISMDQLRDALELQRIEGGRLGSNLIKLGYIDEETLVSFLSRQYKIPSVVLSEGMINSIEPALYGLIPIEKMEDRLVLPIKRVGTTLKVAMADPIDVFTIDEVRFITGYDIDIVVAAESAIKGAIRMIKNRCRLKSDGGAGRFQNIIREMKARLGEIESLIDELNSCHAGKEG